MFHQFLATSSEIQFFHRTDIGELKDAILEIKISNLKSPLRDEFIDTSLNKAVFWILDPVETPG